MYKKKFYQFLRSYFICDSINSPLFVRAEIRDNSEHKTPAVNIIANFLDKWSTKIMLPLSIVVFLKTCSTSSKIEKLKNTIKEQSLKTDSIIKSETISKEDIEKMLKIEGLKVEKRMIQSTDRKILDVNRQSEIDKEIQELEK